MAEYTIYADFDRDGKVSGSAREAALSKTYPGAILVPNLDVDPQGLPSRATLRATVPRDFESKRRVQNENDLTKVIIRKNPGGSGVPHTLLLRVRGAKAKRLKIFTLGKGQRKVPLVSVPGLDVQYDLPEISSELTIYLEIDSFAGSLDIPPEAARPTDAGIGLSLYRLEAGVLIIDDFAIFTIAPLIFLDNGASAKRVYMCDMPSTDDQRGNEPAVHDFKEGMKKHNPKVPVIMIPRSANGGDAWVQDQYQIGYVHDGSRVTKRMVLHIPRLRSNVVLIDDTPNLAAFVNSHFPSQNVGVCNALWKQPAGTFQDAETSADRVMSFDDSFETYLIYRSLMATWQALVRFDLYLRPWPAGTSSLSPVTTAGDKKAQEGYLMNLEPSVMATYIDEYTAKAIEKANELGGSVYAEDFRRRRARLQEQMTLHFTKFQELVRVVFNLRNGPRSFTSVQFDDTFRALDEIHASKNYGGNLEVIPGSSTANTAPLGKILLGSKDSMNRPLVNFLEQQAVQPLVDIETHWLGVGHVDEIVTFVVAPDRANDVCFHADTRVALEILETASERHLQGVDDHVVTQLFRGMRWLYSRPHYAADALEPPRFYQELPQTEYHAVGDDKYYNASVHLEVFLEAVADVNAAIQDEFLTPNVTKLKEHAQSAVYVPLPALFDTVPYEANDKGARKYDWDEVTTGAIVPGAANMQVVGKTLFIPRQYTARMRADDVIWVLKKVMPADYHDLLNKEIFKRRGLNEYPVWLHGPFYTENNNDLLFMAIEFQDGFWEHGTEKFDSTNNHTIEKADKVQKLIYKRNRSAFTRKDRPMLKRGWNKIYIPENTVDLFEAYIQTAANHYGFDVHWVDTWYYHLRYGQIHCGTNVVRNPEPSRRTPWWDVRRSVVLEPREDAGKRSPVGQE